MRRIVLGWGLVALTSALVASACGGDSKGGGPGPLAGEAGAAREPNEGGGAGGASSEPGAAGMPAQVAGQGGAGEPVEPMLGGAAGEPSLSGAGGQGGESESLYPPGTATLGSDCSQTSECQQGLTCVNDTTAVVDGATIPGGLCTRTCTTDTQCQAFSPGALCYPFDPDGFEGYCVEGCAFGPTLFRKCHARDDFGCMPGLLTDTGYACETGCYANEICQDGTCQTLVPACLPSCRGDLDCAEGYFCDGGWLRGNCVKQRPPGKKLGEACNVPGPFEPTEPDECEGVCIADVAGGATGHCHSTCALGEGCAWNPQTELFDGACYTRATTVENGDIGDFGFCTAACNCAAECLLPGDACFSISGLTPLDEAHYRGAGVCTLDEDLPDPIFEQCD